MDQQSLAVNHHHAKQMFLSAKHVAMQIRKIANSLIECTLSARRDSILLLAPLGSLEEGTSAQ